MSRPGHRGRALATVIVSLAIVTPAAALQAQEVPEAQGAQEEETESPPAEAGQDDGRRTIKGLPASFGRGAVGVFSRKSLPPLVVGAMASALFIGADASLANPDGADDSLGKFGAGLGDPVYVGGLATALLISGRMSSSQRWRNATYDVFVASGVNYAYTEALKLTVRRVRPNEQNNKSFPSGHTSNAFAWATVLEQHYGLGVGIPLYALASVVGISRVTHGKHYMTDVFAGAAIGFIVGRSVVRQGDEPREPPPLVVFPMVGPRGQPGLGFRLEF